MPPGRQKSCPVCGTLAPIASSACRVCGHAYRTSFAPTPAPAPVSSHVPPPPPRPSAGAGTSPPLEWSDSYAAGRRRMKWVWGIGGTIVGIKLISLAAPILYLLVTSHMIHSATAP